MAFVTVALLPGRVRALPASAARAHGAARVAVLGRRVRLGAAGAVGAAPAAPVKKDARIQLERLLVQTAPQTEPGRVRRKVDPGRKYKVLIFNDETHSKDFVVQVLCRVVPQLTQEQAWNIMETAHRTGRALVGVWVFEISEAYCDMLRSNGLRADIEEE